MGKTENKNWYILFVRGGHEIKIIDSINDSLRKNNIDQSTVEVTFIENDQSLQKRKNLLSGYIFINCDLNAELLSILYKIPGIISFLGHKRGDSSLPVPISSLEVKKLLMFEEKKNNHTKKRGTIDKQKKETSKKSAFNVGDLILVKNGFFKDNRGSVTKIDNRKNSLTININFFGRSTPVSIDFSDCDKI